MGKQPLKESEIGTLFIVSFNRPSFFEKTGEETIQSEPPTIHKTIHKELFATEKAVIEIIKENPNITRKELATRLNLSEAGVRYNTDKLQTKGILRRVGGKKEGWWEVIDDQVNASGGVGVGGRYK